LRSLDASAARLTISRSSLDERRLTSDLFFEEKRQESFRRPSELAQPRVETAQKSVAPRIDANERTAPRGARWGRKGVGIVTSGGIGGMGEKWNRKRLERRREVKRRLAENEARRVARRNGTDVLTGTLGKTALYCYFTCFF
jgi:hypothetical protein